MLKQKRAGDDPVADLQPVKVVPKHERRALSVDELRRLIAAAQDGPTMSGGRHLDRRWRMSGGDRAILYRLAAETGLRRAELASLTRGCFNLDADPPTVTVSAAYSKNHKRATIPLRPGLIRTLRPKLSLKR
jgi:integrase